MSISTKHGKVKNVAYNFSDAQVKVREATSNDPWGPSTALMSEIADLTHNPMAFTEIMSFVWKRLNDSGKNWRHVYKSLVLLDFLIKCGHEKVAQQCRENVFTIETLKDFEHVEDSRDRGLNIREKAHQITSLLPDDERLKNERTRFILTRNKFKQNNPGPVGAESRRSNRHHISDSALGKKHLGPMNELLTSIFPDPEYEEARPSTATEEEMQLQIALALSREECKKEADRLATTKQGTVSSGQLTQSALDDLLSLGVGELVSGNSDQPSSSGAWNSMGMADPWGVPQSSTPASAQTNDGSMKNDDKSIRKYILNDVLEKVPIDKSYEDLCKVIGNDSIAFYDFQFWYYRFLSGQQDLDFDRSCNTTLKPLKQPGCMAIITEETLQSYQLNRTLIQNVKLFPVIAYFPAVILLF
ncbi:hypothetical protein CAEBREN_29988 [Caenorhabditis brenneri]|uniref:ENTH domain-containing protein n=1 Tax=Caenorhabditis brenneri TaxID=135651 RepID=G0NZC2_CAEBE|nr:hypothetical protein CAEBREN_29988 [Caenorhabditis brenneri]